MSRENKQTLTRRGFFQRAGLTGLSCVAAGAALTGLPRSAEATPVNDLVVEHFGSAGTETDKIKVGGPEKADSGALVRVPITVDLPQTPDNYVKQLGIFVENNPRPLAAMYEFGPEIGRIDFEIRIKMAKSSPLRVVAKTTTGKVLTAVKKIEVAEGGCAG